MPELGRIIVTNSGEGLTKVLDARTYAIVDTWKLAPGADVMSYDPSTRTAWIVTGGKNAPKKLPHTTVAVVDPVSGKTRGEIRFDTDFTEAIAFEQQGTRAFINVSGRHEVADLGNNTHNLVSTWGGNKR